MRFQDLNWMDVESYLKQDDRIIMITGATEQHAYNSLLTDIEIPSRIAMAVAQQTQVLIAPPLNFGLSEFFMQYPGTITLRPETFAAVVVDVIRSLQQHGFKRILLLNGHGGNHPPAELETLRTEHPDLTLKWHNWWNSPVARQFAEEKGLQLGHANWSECFSFVQVADIPTEIKPMLQVNYKDEGADARTMLGDGSTGGHYRIDDNLMQDFFQRVVAEIGGIVEGL